MGLKKTNFSCQDGDIVIMSFFVVIGGRCFSLSCRIIYLMSSTRASYLTLHGCDSRNRSLLCTYGHNPREQLTAGSSGHSRPKFSSKHCWTRVGHLDNCTFWPLQATQQCLSCSWGSSESIMRAQALQLLAKRAFSSSPPLRRRGQGQGG